MNTEDEMIKYVSPLRVDVFLLAPFSFVMSAIAAGATADFLSAQSFMKECMRMGNKYIFCKRTCTILRYYNICKQLNHN